MTVISRTCSKIAALNCCNNIIYSAGVDLFLSEHGAGSNGFIGIFNGQYENLFISWRYQSKWGSGVRFNKEGLNRWILNR